MTENAAAFAVRSLHHISEALRALDLDHVALEQTITAISETQQPVVCSGVGKSGFIAAKFAATLNSLAIRAFHLNPTDALHGDMGFVADGSVVILMSNSGTTAELRNLLPALQARNCLITSVVSDRESPLARAATYTIAYGGLREVDEHGLAPTTSTVVQLALADVLAAAASRRCRFPASDFYRNHPAGALGKRFLKVDLLMRTDDQLPVVDVGSSLTEALETMTQKYVGCACVVESDGRLVGLITDGDIRRALARRVDIYSASVLDIMERQPQIAYIGERVEKLMQKNEFLGRHFSVPVVDDEHVLRGILVSIDLI